MQESSLYFTDAHCHLSRSQDCRHFICAPYSDVSYSLSKSDNVRDVFFDGVHPWFYSSWDGGEILRQRLAGNANLGVGEIGLDRLKEKTISSEMRKVFVEQLAIAAEFSRPVVLHGAKCWGQVVRHCQEFASKIPSFLFHGFSRSGGLIPDIAKLNGFISVGPAVLNDHAINYRELVAEIPLDMLLIESDATSENADSLFSTNEIATKIAELKKISISDLYKAIEENANRFLLKIEV